MEETKNKNEPIESEITEKEPVETRQKLITAPTKSDIDEWEKVTRLLDGANEGCTVSITRVQPAHCSGWLETITVSAEYPVNPEYLASTWGGEILRLRLNSQKGVFLGQTTLNLRSYKPRHKGVIIEPPGQAEIATYYGFDKNHTPQQAQEKPPSIADILAIMAEQRKADLQMMTQLVSQHPSAPKERGVTDLLKQVRQVEELKNILGGDSKGELSDNPMDSIKEILELYLKAQNGKKQPPPISLVDSRKEAPKQIQKNPQIPQNPQPDIALALAALEPDKAAETFLRALAAMEEEKREQTIGHIYSAFDGEEEDQENAENLNRPTVEASS